MDNIRFYNGPERGLPARLQPISLPQNQEELFVSLQTADLPPLGPFETPNPSREAAQHACVSLEALSLVRTPSAAETTGALSQPAPVHYEETASTSSVAHPLGRVRAARPSLSS
ncbi:hypothetical protein AC578_2991 [Pseudocercospora eumusae]|uniref:Uncharacterized protein n=1 Tax=Pseudocercospora eumusae TaxID=321146 RepID=A0A139GX50_9PEZI|nr:hypothetical protein AC578_2991 [Pseudocercospora eumusae]